MSPLGSTRPRGVLVATAALGLALVAPGLSTPAGAAPGEDRTSRAAPRTIDLPDGFQPEGIATGRGGVGYVGSLDDGRIYSFDLATGRRVSVTEGPGTASVGLALDRRSDRLYVAGGDAGTARVVDTRTGRTIADYTLAEGEAFINDVILTRKAAWFTNSASPEVYRVPIGVRGKAPAERLVRVFDLRGDWAQPEGFGANGITRTPDGKALLVVNSTDGTLFRVGVKGRRAGVARQVDLGGQSLTNGDGMLQRGRTLYVVRNRSNVVVELRLDPRGLSGRKVGALRIATFDVPTTLAAARGNLYLPNARFGTDPTPRTPYTVSVVERR